MCNRGASPLPMSRHQPHTMMVTSAIVPPSPVLSVPPAHGPHLPLLEQVVSPTTMLLTSTLLAGLAFWHSLRAVTCLLRSPACRCYRH
jgi:hypothetical protein